MKIAITGTIGSGKSQVIRYLKEQGRVVYEADKIAHQQYEPGTLLYNWIIKKYGIEILDASKRVDRAKLAHIVFNDHTELKELEMHVFPAVRSEILTLEVERSPEILFVEIPLLFEAEMDKDFDAVWVVDTDDAIRHARLLEKGMTQEDIDRREARQLSREEKRAKATHIFENNTTIDDLNEHIATALRDINL